jgi:mannitol-1-phosphate 5-dehydrogenase
MYGGGNIGRGFIGALFSEAGYDVTFIDVTDSVVEMLHRERRYPVRIVSSEGYEDIDVVNVDAVHGNDTEKVARLIAKADIMATAVGAGALKFIVPNIAAGIRARFSRTDKPLDILICENLMDADKVLEDMIKAHLTDEEKALFDKRIGLVEVSIGRMVPVQTAEMQDGNPLRVCVEQYGYLPVDKNAFKGGLPAISKLIPASPFSFYIKRKLFLHNMGHAVCAYLGLYSGFEYIYETIDCPQIHLIVKNAMLESVEALALAYGEAFTPILRHTDDLLYRFTNRALADTCARVGQDPKRKLSPTDRLIGAAKFCAEQEVLPAYIAIGAAGAVYRLLDQSGQAQDTASALTALQDISALQEVDELTELVMDMYRFFLKGATPERMMAAAQKRKNRQYSAVI